jgi:hypothetical protein
MLLRRAVPTQEGIALKTSSLTGHSQLGWRLEAERPAFALLRSQLWACQDLNLRPHPYQRWTAERCAIQPLRWSCHSRTSYKDGVNGAPLFARGLGR